jgi:hypothetical protein
MSARMDVLAVIDRAHAAFSGLQAGELFAARAAVAELIAFAEGFSFTVTDSYYKDAYLSITRPDKSVVFRLTNSSTVSEDIADIERRRVAALSNIGPSA